MNRYHREVYTEPRHWDNLEAMTDNLNKMDWGYSAHCLDNLKSRSVNLEELLRFIKNIRLDISQIFEYYLDDTAVPIKICYRITAWSMGIDIILVLDNQKQIITIYMNGKDDKHETLKQELYERR